MTAAAVPVSAVRTAPGGVVRPLDYLALAVTLVAMLACGTKFAAANLLVEAGSLALLVGLIWSREWTGAMRACAIFAGAALAMLALQIVPLPTRIWMNLPGHEVAAAIVAYAGGGGWHALSVSPFRTLETATTLIPAAALSVWAAGSGELARRHWARLIVAVALVSAIIGFSQFGGGGPYLRPTAHEGSATGFFANRNHLATLLAIAIALCPAALTRPNARQRIDGTALAFGAVAVLLLASVATTSRMGLILVLVSFTITSARLIGASGVAAKTRRVLVGAAAAGVAAVAVLLLLDSDTLPILARFADAGEDARFVMWSDTLYAARTYLPWGAGFGNFTPVYNSVENLDLLTAGTANEAHNEYLQIMLAGGVPGAALAGLLVATLSLKIAASFRKGAGLLAAGVGLGALVVLAHSVVDYPLRSYALLVPFAAMVGILFAVQPGKGQTTS